MGILLLLLLVRMLICSNTRKVVEAIKKNLQPLYEDTVSYFILFLSHLPRVLAKCGATFDLVNEDASPAPSFG